jgi:hypothetical protein
MAEENIQISQSNFCIGPQLGTLCTIDTTNPTTVLRVKDTGGNTIIDLTLSSNITSDNIRLEYTGPPILSSMVDDLTFFTFERISNTRCMIKRWTTRMAYRELLLKEQIVKNNIGDTSFNAIDFAVEYYNRRFDRGAEYYNYLYMNSIQGVKNGTRLFLGPSTDTTNLGATETVTVSSVADIHGEKRVYLTSYMKYQYARDDLISLYTNVFVYSKEAVPGDDRKGALIKLDAYNWSIVSKDTKSIYRRVTASKWCPQVQGIASVIGTNMLFVRPYDSYQNWRSMFLNNVKSDNNTIFDVYDIAFDNFTVYKLQKFITLKNDVGNKTTYPWDYYNYQEDTLSPYSNNVNIWFEDSFAIGYYQTKTINVQVRDQFHVGLRDVIVQFYKEPGGDDESYLWPYSGLATTDTDGKATMDYRSGADFYGSTFIHARATGSTNATGSEFSWSKNSNIISYPFYTPFNALLFQKKWWSGRALPIQIDSTFMISYYSSTKGHIYRLPDASIKADSYFTSPGGRWGDGTDGNDDAIYELPQNVRDYLPELYTGVNHTDGPIITYHGFGFSNWPYTGVSADKPFFIGNQIKLINEFDTEIRSEAVKEFKIHHGRRPPGDPAPSKEEGWVPYKYIIQPDESDRVQISQLKLSLHTHWLDGEPLDELIGYTNIDQFIFVEDAIPKFWSEKNPVDTDVWIRLRPFAFSLDNSTLRMWLKVVSYLGNTGYYEITNDLVLDNFDAGGGLLGIEVLYDPLEDFPHASLVYVKIEVYDEAYIPNFITVNYWWYVTPDYKAPYLTNLSPSREEEFVSVDKKVYFEIKDKGTGIDLDSLEILLNSRLMVGDYLDIEVVNKKHIKVTYTPPQPLYFSKDYKVTVKCNDSSPQKNRMNDSYMFYTADSTGVFITDPSPIPCKRGLTRFEDVSAVVLADGNGIDRRTVRMQVYNKDVHPRVLPIIYRVG